MDEGWERPGESCPSPGEGLRAEFGCQDSPAPPSSLRLRQASLGLRFRSLTCCSKPRITSTALFMIPNFVMGLSDFMWELQIRPNSFNASLISLILTLSLWLLLHRLSLSFLSFSSGSRDSSSAFSASSDLRIFLLLGLPLDPLPPLLEELLGCSSRDEEYRGVRGSSRGGTWNCWGNPEEKDKKDKDIDGGATIRERGLELETSTMHRRSWDGFAVRTWSLINPWQS